MAQQNIKLSTILTTHIPKPDLFNILHSILRMDLSDTELIMIDDDAPGEIKRELQETIRTYNNDFVFLLEHDAPSGRGNSLNEALIQATGKFVWTPVRAERFHVNLYKQALNRFSSDPAGIWVLDYDLPPTISRWLDDAEKGNLPDDSCFIWNRAVLVGEEFFFNPFLTHLHGAELAMRVYENHVWHRTDPFFVIGQNQYMSPAGNNLEEFFRTAHRSVYTEEEKKRILKRLSDTDVSPKTDADDKNLLTQSRQLLVQDNAGYALELINAFLKKKPRHAEALQIKISTLERLRRHVEAAELKHDLRHILKQEQEPKHEEHIPEKEELSAESETEAAESGEPEEHWETPPVNEESHEEFSFSVVIPTTGLGKFDLERCISSIEKAAPKSRTELIVIDNASIDDTFDYLDQLTEKNLLNIRVITNQVNTGFAASVNLGISEAKGDFVLVLHNDVVFEPDTFERLAEGFDQDSDIVLVAPALNSSEYAAQDTAGKSSEDFLLTDKIDSCCFMVKKDFSLQLDEEYGLAFFEMEDLCRQVSAQGHKIAVVPGVVADHKKGKTTGKMGFGITPQRKWRNRHLFQQKWGDPVEYTIPKQGSIADRLERLEPPIDPSNPPEEWVEAVEEFLTDEIRTVILRSDMNKRELLTIVSTLLMADNRELLRTLEDRLNDMDLPVPMLMLFINFYYEKNIYSRCRHYLKKAGDTHPAFDLFRLKIHVADKEKKQASELLTKLLKKYPASPDLFSLAARLYRQDGDEDEANSFAAMANQLDPLTYPPEETAFEVKF